MDLIKFYRWKKWTNKQTQTKQRKVALNHTTMEPYETL